MIWHGWPIVIDGVVGMVETAGMSETAKPERRFQFRLRKLLLWTTVVALGLGVLSTVEPDGVSCVVFPGWLAAVLILRWGFGSRVAATVSVMAGMLLFALPRGLAYAAIYGWHEKVLVGAVVGGILGGITGIILFALVEVSHRTVDWLDRIGQSDE